MNDLPICSNTVVNNRPGFLREGIPNYQCSVMQSEGDMFTYDLKPPPTISTALVVPTKALIKGSRKITDSTAFRSLSDLVEAKMAFLKS